MRTECYKHTHKFGDRAIICSMFYISQILCKFIECFFYLLCFDCAAKFHGSDNKDLSIDGGQRK